MKFKINPAFYLILCAIFVSPTLSSEELNVYSARKEAYIKPLLDQFSQTHNVQVNLVTSKADALIQRLIGEGENTPADVLITVDAGRLYRAQQAGLLRSIDGSQFTKAAPSQFQDPQGYWFGLSLRARTIVYHPQRVQASELSDYASLADPRWKQRICIRSSNNIYNQSLVASMIAHDGVETTQHWANHFVGNFARKPQGGDRDQIKAVAAGQCDIAVVNSYYLGSMLIGSDAEKAAARSVRLFWPNQQERGVHMNISGIAVTQHAKNSQLAIQLIEFLYTDEAQAWYGDVNMEYPVRKGITTNPTLLSWGDYQADDLALTELGVHNSEAVKIMDKAGWK